MPPWNSFHAVTEMASPKPQALDQDRPTLTQEHRDRARHYREIYRHRVRIEAAQDQINCACIKCSEREHHKKIYSGWPIGQRLPHLLFAHSVSSGNCFKHLVKLLISNPPVPGHTFKMPGMRPTVRIGVTNGTILRAFRILPQRTMLRTACQREERYASAALQ